MQVFFVELTPERDSKRLLFEGNLVTTDKKMAVSSDVRVDDVEWHLKLSPRKASKLEPFEVRLLLLYRARDDAVFQRFPEWL